MNSSDPNPRDDALLCFSIDSVMPEESPVNPAPVTVPDSSVSEQPVAAAPAKENGDSEAPPVEEAQEAKEVETVDQGKATKKKVKEKKEKVKCDKKDETSVFKEEGVAFRAKLIGIEEVREWRGNEVCDMAMTQLKAAVIASKQHKRRITITLGWNEVVVKDEATDEKLHVLPLNVISFVWKDPADNRACGLIAVRSDPDTKTLNPRFYAYKTEKQVMGLIQSLKSLFTLKEEEKKRKTSDTSQEETKSDHQNDQQVKVPTSTAVSSAPTEKLNDLVDFTEDSNAPTTNESLADIFASLSTPSAPVTQSQKPQPSVPSSISLLDSVLVTPVSQPGTQTDPWGTPSQANPAWQQQAQPNAWSGANTQTTWAGQLPPGPGAAPAWNAGQVSAQAANPQFAWGGQGVPQQQQFAMGSNFVAPTPAAQGYYMPRPLSPPPQAYGAFPGAFIPPQTSMGQAFYPNQASMQVRQPTAGHRTSFSEQQMPQTTATNPFTFAGAQNTGAPPTAVPSGTGPFTSVPSPRRMDSLFSDLVADTGLNKERTYKDKSDMFADPKKPSLTDLAFQKQQQSVISEQDLNFLEGGVSGAPKPPARSHQPAAHLVTPTPILPQAMPPQFNPIAAPLTSTSFHPTNFEGPFPGNPFP